MLFHYADIPCIGYNCQNFWIFLLVFDLRVLVMHVLFVMLLV